VTVRALPAVEAGAKRNVGQRILDGMIQRRVVLRDDPAAGPHKGQDDDKTRPFPERWSFHGASIQ
jgi:hypothetical protein